jgi:hypothetical protein
MPIDPTKIPPWMQQLNGMQLSPEQMAQLNQQFAGNYGTVNRDGFDFAPAVEYGQGESGAGNNTIHGYSAIPQGTTWNLKDGEDFYGGFDKSGKFEGARQPHAFDMGDAAPFLFALAAGGAALAPGSMGAALGTGSTAAGPGMAGWGADLGVSSAAGMGSGGAAAGGAAGAAGAASGGGAMGTMAPLELASYGSTGLPGAMSTAGAGSGGLGSLLGGLGGGGGGLGSLAGLASTAIGALSGAEGQESEQSSTRDIAPWLKPYAQKVLGMGSSLLDSQSTPEAQQGYTDMRGIGRNLLNRSTGGNGFAQRDQFGSNLLDQYYPQGMAQPAPQQFAPAQTNFAMPSWIGAQRQFGGN